MERLIRFFYERPFLASGKTPPLTDGFPLIRGAWEGAGFWIKEEMPIGRAFLANVALLAANALMLAIAVAVGEQGGVIALILALVYFFVLLLWAGALASLMVAILHRVGRWLERVALRAASKVGAFLEFLWKPIGRAIDRRVAPYWRRFEEKGYLELALAAIPVALFLSWVAFFPRHFLSSLESFWEEHRWLLVPFFWIIGGLLLFSILLRFVAFLVARMRKR